MVGRRREELAVAGPTRIYVRRIPAGAVLDLEHYLSTVITSLADEFMDELQEIADDRAITTVHDGYKPEELLVERLCERIGYTIPLYGEEVTRLADRLRAVAPKPRIPRQRAEGGAAA
ncbi:hypothetical protein CTZ27_37125 [Streptomyces griseocarneus]|nr:hypothetical protein CTZ27_37125 [Streptomyces griseocarneus]